VVLELQLVVGQLQVVSMQYLADTLYYLYAVLEVVELYYTQAAVVAQYQVFAVPNHNQILVGQDNLVLDILDQVPLGLTHNQVLAVQDNQALDILVQVPLGLTHNQVILVVQECRQVLGQHHKVLVVDLHQDLDLEVFGHLSLVVLDHVLEVAVVLLHHQVLAVTLVYNHHSQELDHQVLQVVTGHLYR
jgi:hypothetical protein